MSLVPFDDRDGWIWMDGEFVPWREAKVHVLTHSLRYASAVFEGERMYGGEIFKLTEHSQRLHRSAELLDFKIPFSAAEVTPVAEIGEHTYKPGNISLSLMDDYSKLVRRQLQTA